MSRLQHLTDTIKKVIATNERASISTDVSIIDLVSNQTIISHNPEQEQFAASTNKAPVARLLLHDLRAGKLAFKQVVSWPADQVLAGTGYYDQPGAPTTASLQDLLFDMLNRSGNTAVNVFVQDVLGGATTVNQRFKSELDLTHTYLQPLDDGNFYLGNTASGEAVITIQKLIEGNDEYARFVLNAVSTDIFDYYGVKSQLADFSGVQLARKVGYLNYPTGNNRHDIGVIHDTRGNSRYAYAILTTAQHAEYDYPTAQGGASLAYIGRALLEQASADN